MEWIVIIAVLWIVSAILHKKPSTMEHSRPSSSVSTPIVRKFSLPEYDQFMTRDEKKAYLSSDKWATKRRIVLYRDGHQCQRCGETSSLECHHISYERLGDEELHQLVTVCRFCHQEIHDRLGYDRTTQYPIN